MLTGLKSIKNQIKSIHILSRKVVCILHQQQIQKLASNAKFLESNIFSS